MEMDIALALGLPNVDDLQHLPYRVYQEWFTYFESGPLLWRILDQHFSRLETILINTFRDRKKSSSVKVSDFLVFAPHRVHSPTGEELFEKLLLINRAYGGDVIDKREPNAET